jgi:glycosyltransferase involved in cell wall biosynthesis
LSEHRDRRVKRRPRLLFLARAFPPVNAAACIRTWNIAKHLARLGWEVTVVTPDPAIWRHVDDPEATERELQREGIGRILTGHRLRWLDPDRLRCSNQGAGRLAGGLCRHAARFLRIDPGIGWTSTAYRSCARLTAADVDVVLASGPPFASFAFAKRLADRLGRPYVLDYRDPWTGSPHAGRRVRSATVRREARLLAGAAAVTIVSPSWATALDRRFDVGSKLHVIANGYDPEDLALVKPAVFDHFAIVYAGTFYPPKRVITPVMDALKRLEGSTSHARGAWYFHYYGPQGSHVSEEAKRFGLEDRVILHGTVPRSEALSAVRGAGVAIVITSVFESTSLDDEGIVTGKVFETLGLETPILLVAPSGSDARAVVENAGVAGGFTGSDTTGMASFLGDLMLDRRRKPIQVSTYEWASIAKRLDAILLEAQAKSLHITPA